MRTEAAMLYWHKRAERAEKALNRIADYGTNDGDLLKGHEEAMRNIARNVLDLPARPVAQDEPVDEAKVAEYAAEARRFTFSDAPRLARAHKPTPQ